jgi:hypothetical protein
MTSIIASYLYMIVNFKLNKITKKDNKKMRCNGFFIKQGIVFFVYYTLN